MKKPLVKKHFKNESPILGEHLDKKEIEDYAPFHDND